MLRTRKKKEMVVSFSAFTCDRSFSNTAKSSLMKSSNLDCETSTGVPLSGVGSFRARLGDGALLLESFEAAVEVASPPLLLSRCGQ